VTVYAAEIYFDTVGSRLFDLSVNGGAGGSIDNIDLVALFGGLNKYTQTATAGTFVFAAVVPVNGHVNLTVADGTANTVCLCQHAFLPTCCL
jgi:hypothetical protein